MVILMDYSVPSLVTYSTIHLGTLGLTIRKIDYVVIIKASKVNITLLVILMIDYKYSI